jgi:hypothetical protein
MPSHAVPPGRDGRAHRRLARRRLQGAWQILPLMLLLWTCIAVVGQPSSQGSAMSQVLSWLRTCLLSPVLATLVFVVALVLRSRVNAWRAPASAPRPRWQYLLVALGWLAVASCFALLSLWIGTGLPARASTALSVWSGLYGLVLIGRAASWGRVRALLWWRSPNSP